MHPLMGSYRNLLATAALWLLLAGLVSTLLAQQVAASAMDAFILFWPWYGFLLFICLSNYYICTWLPLANTPLLRLVSVQMLALSIAVFFWWLVGSWWAEIAKELSVETATDDFRHTQSTNLLIGATLYLVWVLAHYAFIEAAVAQQERSEQLEKKLLISQVELQMVKASVHPHFMYNCLNMLANLALVQPEKVHDICVQMSDFLRYSVNYGNKAWVTLGDELNHISNYLRIESERFGERLHTDLQVDEQLRSLRVIPLILFPLIENSIKHGIGSSSEPGYIRLRITRENDLLIIRVDNSYDPQAKAQKGTGLGLQALNKRLLASFGLAASVHTQAGAKAGVGAVAGLGAGAGLGEYSVTLRIPLEPLPPAAPIAAAQGGHS